MSESIRRRSSSRQLLQNLIRVTAQRSQEDAEEVERERRRRSRETPRGEGSPPRPEPPLHPELSQGTESDEELKPRCRLVLEEDEGFSDWSHRLENRSEREQVPGDCRANGRTPTAPRAKPGPREERQQGGEEEGRGPERSSRSQEASASPAEKVSGSKKEARTSYSSSVFLPQDTRLAAAQPADRTSYLAAGTMRPRWACRVDGEQEEQEELKKEVEGDEQQPGSSRRSAGTRQSCGDEDDPEEDELSFAHEERDEEKDEERRDLRLRREHRHREEEEEELKMQDTRSEEAADASGGEANRRSAASLCGKDEEPLNCYGPMSPTFKKLLIQFYPDEINSRVSTDGKCTIIERTESLRRSTSNIKKTPPPVSVSKIDKKLEQYAHALQLSSKEGRLGAQAPTDLTGPSEPVAAKKNLFEAGEAWNQNATSVTASKDADGLKVGVADLINQWVRGGEDGSRCGSPSKPAESPSGKKYKFVVAGHGKYQKVSDGGSCSEDVTRESAGEFDEDL